MLVGVAEYALFFVTINSGTLLWLPFVIVAVWNLLALVATVITIVDSIRKVRAKNSRQLATDAMVAKLASIPFFMVSFFVLTGSLLVSFAIVLFGGPVLWIVIPIVGVLTYFVLLSTSIYGWAAIVQMRRERVIGTVRTVVYAILLFVPIADTVVGVLLFGRRRPRLALAVSIFDIGLILAVFGFVGVWGLTSDEDGLGSGGVVSIVVIVVGFGLILATGIAAVVLRSSLRAEAQPVADEVGPSMASDASDLVTAD